MSTVDGWCSRTKLDLGSCLSDRNFFVAQIATIANLAGYRIKKNQDYGTELALCNSVMLMGSAIPRIIKTGGRAPVPIALGATGALATWYYQKKVREFRYGV